MPYADPEVNKAYQKAYQKEWDAKNPEKRKAIDKRSAIKHADKRKAKREEKYDTERRYAQKLKQDFNLTLEQYYQMVADQGGKCKICGRPPSEGKRLAVDHCHRTGKVRGLLCHRCNGGLGMFCDDRFSLQKAIEYLTDSYEDDWLSELEKEP